MTVLTVSCIYSFETFPAQVGLNMSSRRPSAVGVTADRHRCSPEQFSAVQSSAVQLLYFFIWSHVYFLHLNIAYSKRQRMNV